MIYKKDKELISSVLLGDLLNEGVYLPVTDSAINISSLRLMLNDIIINNRKSIVEFGSGISTIIFARLFSKNNISGKIFSVDEDSDWIEILNKILKEEKLERFVEFVNAPLVLNKKTKSLNKLRWYDENILEKKLRGRSFDLILVDGPCAYKKNIMLSRYPALPFIYKNLDSRFSVFLDDVNRRGEEKILDLWGREYKIKFSKFDKHLGFGFKGGTYNICF
jgi:hypothetical protein